MTDNKLIIRRSLDTDDSSGFIFHVEYQLLEAATDDFVVSVAMHFPIEGNDQLTVAELKSKGSEMADAFLREVVSRLG